MKRLHYSGDITSTPNTIKHDMLISLIVCKTKTNSLNQSKYCLPLSFLIDTGSDISIISYKYANDLGLDAPKQNEKTYSVNDYQGNSVKYVLRRVRMYIKNNLNKEKDKVEIDFQIGMGLSPKHERNILGMNFLKDYKLIVDGKTKKFYITYSDECIKCCKKL